MSDLKTQPGQIELSKFMANVPDKKRHDSLQLIEMMSEITGCPPIIWGSSIVGFDAYDYQNTAGGGRWFKTGFSPRKQNFSIYIMNGFSQYQELLAQLGKHKLGKSCLYISSLKAVDEKVLYKLIKKSFVDMSKKYG